MSNDLIPEGNYKAVAVKKAVEGGAESYVHFDRVGDRGIPLCIAYFKILDSPVSMRYPLRWQGWFTTKDKDGNPKVDKLGRTSAQRAFESLRAMGLKGDDAAAATTSDMNQIVDVLVQHREYTTNEGEERTSAEIIFVNAVGEVGAIKMSNQMIGAELKKFAAQMKKGLAKIPDVIGERFSESNGNGQAHAAGSATHSTVDEGGKFSVDNPPPIADDEIPF